MLFRARNQLINIGMANPVNKVLDTLDAVGARSEVLKASKGFGGPILNATSVIKEPRKQYNYRVTIESDVVDLDAIHMNVKSVTRPNIHFKYREQRHLNTTRRVIQHVSFDPIKMVVYDDMGGSVSNALKKLLEQKYLQNANQSLSTKDAIQLGTFANTLIKRIVIHSGQNLVSSLASSLVSSDLERILGPISKSSSNTMVMSNCHVTDIDFGDFDYSSSDECAFTLTFDYESLAFGDGIVRSTYNDIKRSVPNILDL